jgi:paraquat-inducible protein A
VESINACKTCGLLQRIETLQPGTAAECFRCGSVIGKYPADSLGRTAAFSLAALVFFVPANIYPILRIDFYGAYSESTVWDGCVRLYQDGQWPVATIVFLASILIPFFKLLGLFLIVFATPNDPQARQVRSGTAFFLYDQPAKAWLEWAPKISIPPGENPPQHARQKKPRIKAEETR